MINQPVERNQGTSSWVLGPGCLIDRFLDNIEKLRSFVLPPKIDDPSYGKAGIEARLEPFSA
jgi:hypothetical protein